MHQILFTIPILKDVFPPNGLSLPGFGAMLFLTFVVTTIWGMRRAKAIGMPPERFQDLVIWLFISGIVGARILYMVQYANQFPDRSIGGLFLAFFQIWKGGIIFYGSALGGAIGYGLFYWYVLRRLNVSGWQLADVIAPLLAVGLAIGRIGCYLNGCCWGQVTVEETCPVPLGPAHFPLLTAHARDQLVLDRGLQTSTGFTLKPAARTGLADPRSEVLAVEPLSAAEAAGLKPGDKIVGVNGRPNQIVLQIAGPDEKVVEVVAALREKGVTVDAGNPERSPRAFFDSLESYQRERAGLMKEGSPAVTLTATDSLWELARDWPRGRADLELVVLRNGQETPLPAFAPRTVGLYPTQLYETVSMVLLMFLLLAYYPFRRHDGQLMTLCMAIYALHRFINESLRVEPAVGLGLTLSQWGSVVILAAAVGIEIYLWRVMPSRWNPAPPPGPTHFAG